MEHLDSRNSLIGREAEARRLSAAILQRESLLIWGPVDAGKTALVAAVIRELPAKHGGNCIYWSGEASVKKLAGEIVRGLHRAGDPEVRTRVGKTAQAVSDSFDRWLRDRTSGQLKQLLFAALLKGRYWIFLDHVAPSSRPMARLLKEIIWRCKTPVYLMARGCTHAEIGHAWSNYFADRYRIRLDAVSESAARKIFEQSVYRFGITPSNPAKFREDIIHLSQRIPGRIVKMCAMAGDPRYVCEGQVKAKVLHADYWMAQASDLSEFLTQSGG